MYNILILGRYINIILNYIIYVPIISVLLIPDIYKESNLSRFYIFFVAFVVLTSIIGCDGRVDIPQMMTSINENIDNYEMPFNMLPSDMRDTFMRGEEAFMKAFTVEEGLGPIFNQASCVSCHPGNGRGIPDLSLIRFSMGHNLMLDDGRTSTSRQNYPWCSLRGPPPWVWINQPGFHRLFSAWD